MRKIIFRGRRPNSGKWITGSFVQLFGFPYILNDEHKTSDCSTEVLPETVGQFTGLTDKNGKEIYEGDIIFGDMIYKNSTLPHQGEVIYSKEYGSFATRNQAGDTLLCQLQLSSFEIIGNIHDNPELLT